MTIQWCPSGGVNEVLNESTLLAYPNPATDHLALSNSAADNLLIYDQHGKCVFRQSAPFDSVLDISGFDPGLYLLILQQDNKAEFQRFLKIDTP